MLGESKLMHAIPRLVGFKVDVNRVFKIPPEPLQIFSKTLNKLIDIPVPSSHIGKEPVSCRLLCTRRRKGMVGEKLAGSNLPEPSKNLIIHVHGGVSWRAREMFFVMAFLTLLLVILLFRDGSQRAQNHVRHKIFAQR
jgi:hypothetical protein